MRIVTDKCVKADLHGTILANNRRMPLLLRALLASHENRENLYHLTLTVATICRRILKHVSKCYESFRFVYSDCRRVAVDIFKTT